MQGDLTQQPLVKRVLLPAVPATYVGAAVEIKSGKNLVLLLKTKISACNGTASKISSLKFTGSPENEAFAQGMRLYQQTEGKRGSALPVALYEQDTKAHAFPTANGSARWSHERFSRVLAQRLVCALLPLYEN
jgi:hypothetical protein